jgi:hypothetical protein
MDELWQVVLIEKWDRRPEDLQGTERLVGKYTRSLRDGSHTLWPLDEHGDIDMGSDGDVRPCLAWVPEGLQPATYYRGSLPWDLNAAAGNPDGYSDSYIQRQEERLAAGEMPGVMKARDEVPFGDVKSSVVRVDAVKIADGIEWGEGHRSTVPIYVVVRGVVDIG